MKPSRNPVRFFSVGEEISGVLFVPADSLPAPAALICHGAGEFKENHFELCELLAERGIASMAIDMHGHGDSGGERFCVRMEEWVADIRAGLDFMVNHPQIDRDRIGAFGLSSGGTAVLEAAVLDDRIKALVTLDATVRDSQPLVAGMFLRALIFTGSLWKHFTGRQLRVSLLKFGGKSEVASDPDIENRLRADARSRQAFSAFPFPGGSEAFFVNTIDRVRSIRVPTLVLWGEDDKIDPPESGQMLYEMLQSKKRLHIIPGNGHAGHLDRNREKVFALTIDWLLNNLVGEARCSK